MKYLLVTCILATLSASLVTGVNIGKFLCENGGAGIDAAMEHTITTKCPPDTTAMNMDAMNSATTEEELIALMAPAFACQWKCIFGLLKAINDKGKLIAAKAETYSKSFPSNIAANIKGKVAACVKAHNPQLKKETGKHAKTWNGFSKCMMDVLMISPC